MYEGLLYNIIHIAYIGMGAWIEFRVGRVREVDRDRDKDENKVRNRERDRDTPRDTRNTMGIFIECSILIGATAFGLLYNYFYIYAFSI